MSYARPQAAAASFNLEVALARPLAAATSFNLAEDGAADPIVYPEAPGVTRRFRLPWGGAGERDRRRASAWGTAPRLERQHALPWAAAEPHQPSPAIPWGDAPRLEPPRLALPWAVPPAREQAARCPWGRPATRERAPRLPWDASIEPRDPDAALPWGDPPPREVSRTAPWADVDLTRKVGGVAAPEPYALPAGDATDLALAGTGYLTPADDAADFNLALALGAASAPNERALPADRPLQLPWGRAGERDLSRALAWGWGHNAYRRDTSLRSLYPDTTDRLLDLNDDPAVPADPQETYIHMNLVNVIRLSDSTPIPVRDLRISLDVDSWAWRFTATVIGAQALALVAPTALGLTDIEVTLNGHTWVFMVERYSGAQGFNDDRYQIHAVSRTQYMAAPYAPRRAKRNAAQLNAVQAAGEELTYTGFLLDWNTQPGATTPDWTYPVGTFAYQDKTPLEVIKQIADSAGAVLIPHKAADGWRLQPRFAVSPWDLAGAYPHAIVHHTQVTRQALEWRPAPLYNAAFVSGTHAGHGVSASRYGTAGDAPAPDLFSDQIVAVDQARERARQRIAASGNHAIIDLSCAIPEASTAPGLIEPGDVLEYQGPGETESSGRWRGTVLGVTIEAPGNGAISLQQTARVIRFYEH